MASPAPPRKSKKRARSHERPAHSRPDSKSQLPVVDGRDELPIVQHKEKLLNAILSNPVTVVVGETGSGKSTQIPQFLCDVLYKNDGARRQGCIVCTQPRRVAAVTIAKRVAAERQCNIGEEVGYSIRFDDCSGPNTRIKFVTDGVLLREALTNGMLPRYSVVILDEAHERSLQTDILMGILKMLLTKRKDLRVVIMSATLESDLFLTYFNNANLVKIQGRQYPVDVYNTRDAEADFLDAAYITCMQIHEEEEEGGVLVFLPGQEDIDGLKVLLSESLTLLHAAAETKENSAEDEVEGGENKVLIRKNAPDAFVIHTLYAAMAPDQQLKAFEIPPPGVRKFVLSTNIAETSVTIPGIKYVVDPGLVKVRCLQADTGIDMLRVLPVSQSQANQRAGRAGRECPGKCFRLYKEVEFNKLELCAIPEIQRISVAQVMLQLISMGIENVVDFPYPSPPSPHTLKKALEQLLCLGALGKDMKITPHGRNVAALPLEPLYANLLIASKQFGCTSEVLTVVSMLSSDNLFIQPHGESEKKMAGKAHMSFASLDGDFISLVNIYEAWKQAKKDRVWTRRHYLNERALLHAEQVRNQLGQLLQQLPPAAAMDITCSCLPEREPILRCLAYGLFLQSANRKLPGQDSAANAWSSQAERKAGYNGMNSSGKSALSTSGRLVIGSRPSDSGAAAYVTMRGGQIVHIHPSSVLFGASSGGSKSNRLPQHVVYAEQVITSKSYIRYVSRIEGDWLQELRPEFFRGRGQGM